VVGLHLQVAKVVPPTVESVAVVAAVMELQWHLGKAPSFKENAWCPTHELVWSIS
jgi:hypothetical protein